MRTGSAVSAVSIQEKPKTLSTSVNATREAARSEQRRLSATMARRRSPARIGLKFAWDAELPSAQKLLLEKPLRRLD